MHNQQLGDVSSKVVGLVLAGGRSTRMNNKDKCFLSLNHKTLLDHAIDRLLPQVKRLVLSINREPSEYRNLDLPVVRDIFENHAGPLAGIHAGMKWTRTNEPDMEWLATVAADTPFIPENMVETFLNAVPPGSKAIVHAVSVGMLHPVCSLWPVSLFQDLEQALASDVRKVRLWTGKHQVIKVEFPVVKTDGFELDPFFNINCPEDLEKAQRLVDLFGI